MRAGRDRDIAARRVVLRRCNAVAHVSFARPCPAGRGRSSACPRRNDRSCRPSRRRTRRRAPRCSPGGRRKSRPIAVKLVLAPGRVGSVPAPRERRIARVERAEEAVIALGILDARARERRVERGRHARRAARPRLTSNGSHERDRVSLRARRLVVALGLLAAETHLLVAVGAAHLDDVFVVLGHAQSVSLRAVIRNEC